MHRRAVFYAADAQADLGELGLWLTQAASEAVARRYVDRIRQRIRALEYASERGTVRDRKRGIRLIGILPTVAVAFSVDEDAVTVHRILYNGQNWPLNDD